MMLACLAGPDGTVALTLRDGVLSWESESPKLAARAEKYVPAGEIPEEGGNVGAWAIRRLAEYIPGDTTVLASNVAPVAKNFSIPA